MVCLAGNSLLAAGVQALKPVLQNLPALTSLNLSGECIRLAGMVNSVEWEVVVWNDLEGVWHEQMMRQMMQFVLSKPLCVCVCACVGGLALC